MDPVAIISFERGRGQPRAESQSDWPGELLGIEVAWDPIRSPRFVEAAKANRELFPAFERRGQSMVRFFAVDTLPRVLQLVSDVFGPAAPVQGPDGQVFEAGAQPPVQEPAPPPASEPTLRATDEPPEVLGRSENARRVGDEVSDGRTEAVVTWVDPSRDSVRLDDGTFVSVRPPQRTVGRRGAEQIAERLVTAAAEEGHQAEVVIRPSAVAARTERVLAAVTQLPVLPFDQQGPVSAVGLPTEILSDRGLPEGLSDYQQEGARWMDARGRAILADEMGLGKAQPIDEPVLTPTGWRAIGSLKPGDRVVDPMTGQSTVVNNVYDRGVRASYRVTFSDGASTECCDEHLWLVLTANDRHRGAPGRVQSLAQLKDSLKAPSGNSRYFIPVTAPVSFEGETSLPIAPWAMGALLGDGSFRGGTPRFSSSDEENIERMRAAVAGIANVVHSSGGDFYLTGGGSVLDFGREHPNALLDALRTLGLWGLYSYEKFVPASYMYASIDDRIALLRGLMDTDGECSADGVAIYNTSSSRMADDVTALVRSLGGVASVSEKAAPSYEHAGEKRTGRVAYRVNVRVRFNPFLLSRRAERWKPARLTRAIERVEHVGDKAMVCISVASDSRLYITRDFVVTHNTVTTSAVIDAPAVIVCPKTLKTNWRRELARWRPDLTVLIVEGATPPPERARNADVVIINYDILGSHADWILQRPNVTLVADEAHMLKNLVLRPSRENRDVLQAAGGSNRARIFFEMAMRTPRLFFLSGTPFENRPSEMFPMLHMVEPRVFMDQIRFRARYESGFRNAELFNRINYTFMLRRRKDVLPDFPEKVRRTMSVSLADDVRPVYQRAANDFLRWVAQTGGAEAAMRAQRAAALTRLNALRKWAALGKVEAAMEFVTEFFESTRRPLVIMAHHSEVFTALDNALREMNDAVRTGRGGDRSLPSRPLRYAIVTGKTAGAARDRAKDAFQDGQLDIIVWAIELATGVTLTRSNDMLFMERVWVPSKLVQAEDRIHRRGQRNNCTITYLDAEGTVDRYMALLLAEKTRTFAGVIDGRNLSEAEAFAEVVGMMFGSEMRRNPSRGDEAIVDFDGSLRAAWGSWDQPL